MGKQKAQSRRGFAYRAVEIIVRPILKALVKRDWRGQENLRTAGGAIVAVNHTSWADPLMVAHFVNDSGRPARFLAKYEVFKVPVLGAILKSAGQIPVRRGSTDAVKSLRAAIEAVNSGECVVIYPEGTLTRDKNLWPMSSKTGIARVALITGAPVIPVAQWGAHEVLPPYSGKPSLFPRKTIKVWAGTPVDLDDLRGEPMTNALLREATDRIMVAVTNLLAEQRGEEAPKTFADRNELLKGSKHDPDANGNLPKRNS